MKLTKSFFFFFFLLLNELTRSNKFRKICKPQVMVKFFVVLLVACIQKLCWETHYEFMFVGLGLNNFLNFLFCLFINIIFSINYRSVCPTHRNNYTHLFGNIELGHFHFMFLFADCATIQSNGMF